MAQSIIVTIDDNAEATYLFDGIAAKWGYESEIDGQPNPETKKDFIGRLLGEFLHTECIQGYQMLNEQAVIDTVKAINIIVT
jgi:hypothetical protein